MNAVGNTANSSIVISLDAAAAGKFGNPPIANTPESVSVIVPDELLARSIPST